jgi:hypothetical protein
MRPPTTIPPIVPALTDFDPELAATCVGEVEADEDEEEVLIDEEDELVPLDGLLPLRKA